MKRLYPILIIFYFLLSVFQSEAKIRDSISVRSIGIDIRPAYIMPTHGFYNGWNQENRSLKAGCSFHAKYSFSFSENSTYGRLFPGAWQGIGFGITSLGADRMIGTPYGFYLFQGSPILRFSTSLNLAYEWNFGLTAGWKTCNNLISSEHNAYINVALLLQWRFSDKWKVTFGPDYTHFSNGDTSFPNGGANTISFRLGVVNNIYGSEDPSLKNNNINQSNGLSPDLRWTYDILLYGTYRADRLLVGSKLYLINDRFFAGGINFNPVYHLNQFIGLGPSLDLIYDESSDLHYLVTDDADNITAYEKAGFGKRTALGLSLRGEVSMPVFTVNVGAGYNILNTSSDLKGYYGIFDLKAFVSRDFFLHVGYRLNSVLYSHNLMFGFGVRL